MATISHTEHTETSPAFSKVQGCLSIEVKSVSRLHAVLSFKDFSPENYSSISFIAKNTDSSEYFYLPATVDASGFTLDLTPAHDLIEFKKSKEYQIYAECTTDHSVELYTLKDINGTSLPYNNRKIFIDGIYFPEDPSADPAEYLGLLAADAGNFLKLYLCSGNYLIRQTHVCSLRSLNMHGGILKICYDLEKGSLEYIKTSLFFRNKLAADAAVYDFTTIRSTQKGNLLRIKISLDLHKIDCKSLYWDVFVILKDLYRIAKPYWKKKHICLVSEKFSSMAQDNGYYFFKHCMDENEEAYLNKKIYYIISKDSPDHYKVDPYKDRVIDFMTVRHMIYTQAADLIVSSDSRYHTYAMVCRHSIFNRYLRVKKFVFLQHGVIALKKVDNFYGKGLRGECDLFVVSTNAEKQTIVDNFGYEPDEVINTGLPRWDVLHDTSEGTREIMIMPTWRNWLDSVPDKDFEESDYFKHYMGLLNSRRFSDILEKYDLQVNFYLHAKFQEYSENFKAVNKRIHLISFGEVAVNEMLMKCRMLITDYSSVSWDILYQDKPILFYQFDLDKYNEAHGSYIDMHKDLFGDRAETEDQLLDYLEETVQNDFRMKPEYEQKRNEYLQFKDNQHSRHICEEIKAKIK